MIAVQILIGALLLAFGRRLFWLFVGVCGFAAGLYVASQLVAAQSEWLALLVALSAGAVGALLAIFFQRLAVGVAGFLGGALIAGSAFDALVLREAVLYWVALGIGGSLGPSSCGLSSTGA